MDRYDLASIQDVKAWHVLDYYHFKPEDVPLEDGQLQEWQAWIELQDSIDPPDMDWWMWNSYGF